MDQAPTTANPLRRFTWLSCPCVRTKFSLTDSQQLYDTEQLNCRLSLLVHKIPFEEELISLADWGATGKAACIKDLNPAGGLPVLQMGGRTYQEHVSICRYLARKVRACLVLI